MPTREELVALRDDCLADDVEIDDEMLSWSIEACREYFESGGTVKPVDISEMEQGDRLALGGVAVECASPSALHLVPWAGPPHLQTPPGLGSQSALNTLRWMMMQLRIGQDMLLLCDPGPRARRLVHWLCALLGRECEGVAITRDTTESDLKQRREMRNGSVVHEPAPPLRAAIHGRVLLLEGVEKAERNVLPLLNNLLENREMAMDDGTFLAAPWAGEGGEDANEEPSTSSGILRCSPDFVVIAIGLPQPAYSGNPLDPPLRSRFACRRLASDAADDLLSLLRTAFPRLSPGAASSLVAACQALRTRSAVGERQANEWERAGGRRRLPFIGECALYDAAESLASLPRLSPHVALHRAFPYDHLALPAADVINVEKELTRLLAEPSDGALGYGVSRIEVQQDGSGGGVASLTLSTTKNGDDVAAATFAVRCGNATLWAPDGESTAAAAASLSGNGDSSNGDGGAAAADDEEDEIDSLGVAKLKQLLTTHGVDFRGIMEKSDLKVLAKAAVAKAKTKMLASKAATKGGKAVMSGAAGVGTRGGGVPSTWRPWCGPGKPLVDSQLHALGELMWMHALGRDVCLLASHGTGKTTIVRRFASLLGYAPYVTFCHQDMASQELLQRRATDALGGTIWVDSPLLLAACKGELAVLDGAHRLARGTLSGALASLLSERSVLTLPDGTRLVSEEHWEALLSESMTEGDLTAKGLRKVKRGFRVLACAEPPTPTNAWLSDELLALFSFLPLPELTPQEQQQLVASHNFPKEAQGAIKALLGYERAIRTAAVSEPSLKVAQPSNRQLLRAARHLSARPSDAIGALRRASAAAMLAMPPAARTTAQALLREAASKEGMGDAAVSAIVSTSGETEEAEGQSGSGPLGSGQAARLVAEAKAQEEAEEKAKRARKLKELEGQAISLRMYNNPMLEQQVDAGAERLEEQKREKERAKLGEVTDDARKAVKGPAGSNAAPSDAIVISGGQLTIGDVSVPLRIGGAPQLIPNPSFVPIAGHVRLLHQLLVDWSLGQHLLLLGEQGVGKNKLADKLLSLLKAEREYVQLHRDTTVSSLTLRPVLEGGAIRHEDSALVRAARLGRVLVVDEADKAPLEVVCVLKALAEDGELTLGDGRRLVTARAEAKDDDDSSVIRIHPEFRMLVLANPPGWPFQGNDFFRECGDVFAAHAVRNVDTASQAQLLRRVAPKLEEKQLVTLLSLFGQLRLMHEEGQLSYPYSVRELVLIARRLQAFPNDGLQGALRDVFDFDAEDKSTAATIADVLAAHGLKGLATAVRSGKAHGDMGLKFEKKSKRMGRDQLGEDHKPPEMKEGGPKHGEWDGKQHMGGNMFAGGSGGTGTAGLGGRGGPYRLDVGQEVHMLTEAEKQGLSMEQLQAAKRMADEAYAARLEELGLAPHDAKQYDAYDSAIAAQVVRMRRVLREHQTRAEERVWLKGRPIGELDEQRLADGVAGATAIYKHRGAPPPSAHGSQRRVSIRFVMDISGSMYTFNRLDGRKTRLLETALFFMQALDGLDAEYEYSMVGHSGTGPEAEKLVQWGEPPQGAAKRLKLLQRMEAHTQFCYPGDQTYEATSLAIQECASRVADERFVFVVSDADLERYGKKPEEWNAILTGTPSVRAYAVLIASNEEEADRISKGLDVGKGYVCTDTSLLASTMEKIFTASVAASE